MGYGTGFLNVRVVGEKRRFTTEDVARLPVADNPKWRASTSTQRGGLKFVAVH